MTLQQDRAGPERIGEESREKRREALFLIILLVNNRGAAHIVCRQSFSPLNTK
jgi:hypothetical protein